MNKVVIVGQGPNELSWRESLLIGADYVCDPEAYAIKRGKRLALTGAAGTKLAKLAGVEKLRFLATVDRRNLNDKWNGKEGKGDKFDREEAKRNAAAIFEQGHPRIVLLGKEVARAFGVSAEFLEERKVFHPVTNAETLFLVFPHPSGLNTWWNEKFNAYRAQKRLRDFLGLPQ